MCHSVVSKLNFISLSLRGVYDEAIYLYYQKNEITSPDLRRDRDDKKTFEVAYSKKLFNHSSSTLIFLSFFFFLGGLS